MLLIVLLVAPASVAERYTSPTQDGQFLVHPIRSYRFLLGLVSASGPAKVTNPGEALGQAKSLFANSGSRPVRVALLYLGGRDSYTYVTKSGRVHSIAAPPDFVWEIWGRDADPSSPTARITEVVGFLDYVTGERIGIVEGLPPAPFG